MKTSGGSPPRQKTAAHDLEELTLAGSPLSCRAHIKVIFRDSPSIPCPYAYVEYVQKDKQRIKIQASLSAAGSWSNAERILRACYAMLAEGASREEVFDFRAQCYAKCGEVPKRGRPPVGSIRTGARTNLNDRNGKGRMRGGSATPRSPTEAGGAGGGRGLSAQRRVEMPSAMPDGSPGAVAEKEDAGAASSHERKRKRPDHYEPEAEANATAANQRGAIALQSATREFTLCPKEASDGGKRTQQDQHQEVAEADVVMALLRNGKALQDATKELKSYREFIVADVKKNLLTLRSVADELRRDMELMAAMHKNPSAPLPGPVANELRRDVEHIVAMRRGPGVLRRPALEP